MVSLTHIDIARINWWTAERGDRTTSTITCGQPWPEIEKREPWLVYLKNFASMLAQLIVTPLDTHGNVLVDGSTQLLEFVRSKSASPCTLVAE